jgi:mRNA interferase MazF
VTPGEIWLIDLGQPVGVESAYRRPAVVVGSPRMRGPLALMCPLTTTMRDFPWRIEVESSSSSGLSRTSYVQCEHLRSISSNRAVTRLGVIDAVSWHRVRGVLRLLLDL